MARIQQLALPRSNRGLLALAVVAGLVAALLAFVILSQGGSDDAVRTTAPEARTVKAVVAARNIPAGTEVTEEMLKVVEVPEDLLVRGAFATAAPLVGEITQVSIAQGEQITGAKIGPVVEGAGLSYVLPRGYRAIGVQVEELTAVGGHLLVGDHVDILATFQSRNAEGLTTVVTVLRDVEVLTVARQAQQPLAVSSEGEGDAAAGDRLTSGQVPDDTTTAPDARTITVAVTPAEALLLAYVHQEAAKIWTVLRPAGEDVSAEERAIDFPTLERIVQETENSGEE